MSKIIIALLALMFFAISLLSLCILLLALALLFFAKKGKKETTLHSEIKGS
jgi:hypothetical protein